jgi:hypothetical protein
VRHRLLDSAAAAVVSAAHLPLRAVAAAQALWYAALLHLDERRHRLDTAWHAVHQAADAGDPLETVAQILNDAYRRLAPLYESTPTA